MNSSNFGIFVFFLFCNAWKFSLADKRLECYVNATVDKTDPNNIYKCNLNTTCCYEAGVPSCCSVKASSVAVLEQIQLWGTLAALIFILAVLMFCCRHDGDWCCNRKDGGRYKYWCCGPLIYRDGKTPLLPKTVPHDNDDDDDDDLDIIDDEKLRVMNENANKRPANAPPTYEESLAQNIA